MSWYVTGIEALFEQRVSSYNRYIAAFCPKSIELLNQHD